MSGSPSHESATALARLSSRLGLSDEPQDWGIVNADASRLGEFVHVAREEQLTQAEFYGMAELVFASANELLQQEPTANVSDVAVLFTKRPAVAQVVANYWRSLDSEEFPISGWLRDLQR
jgi:hypothetical protein